MLTVTTATSVEFPFSDMLAERAGVMLPDADDMVLDARIVAPSMGQYIPKFNVRPTFFDISDVANPADRIAHHLQYMFADSPELSKSASVEFPFSDMLAERAGVMLPEIDDVILGCAQSWLHEVAGKASGG